MPEHDVASGLIEYIEENLLPAGVIGPIGETSPLLEMGVLDSLKTAMLLNHIRERHGVRVPPLMIEYRNFQDVRSIAAVVGRLLDSPRDGDGRGLD
ncbi:hypothetical protein BJF79_02605 [Actinomadura sp. CNU-125]|uniref:acyl carrier protein n=1 Tax=Actinomadura sp. CNU-125 TaxID=1904961 RepID=UPI000962B733|nr:acyl carrier protein [Actinomadura sp. CNU-125]OLT19124.1 hypothetical protein BJF79_02605 [Actinomadura sp. CNU-125]